VIVLALVLLQAAPDPAALLDQRWIGAMRGSACRTKRSTGDAEIDRVGCVAMEACLPTFESRYAATGDRAIRPEVKKMMRTSLNAELATCVQRERQAGVAALVARRKGA
jgi:hypothetical protein